MEHLTIANQSYPTMSMLPFTNFFRPQPNADKTGKDNDADKTVKRKKAQKSKLEINPDSTGIDTNADKTNIPLAPTPQQKES